MPSLCKGGWVLPTAKLGRIDKGSGKADTSAEMTASRSIPQSASLTAPSKREPL